MRVVLLLALGLLGCTEGQVPQAEKTISITSADFGGYPAVFLSLRTGEVTPVPRSLEGFVTHADLWIEPGDPEVCGLTSSFEGATHTGDDTVVAELENYDAPVGPSSAWQKRLHRATVKTGLCFAVRASDGRHYRVQIVHSDKQDSTLTLRYRSADLP
ncbi:MAG: hypothetical protein V3W41_14160 [Planctomycetota bacterium]